MVLCIQQTDSQLAFKIEWLSTIPSSIGSGVEDTLILLALKYCLITAPKSKLGVSELEKSQCRVDILFSLDCEYLRDHQSQLFIPKLIKDYGFA